MLHIRVEFGEDDRLGRIQRELLQLRQRIGNMATAIERMTAAVERNTTVDTSVVTLVTNLSTQLREALKASKDLETLQTNVGTLVDQLEGSSTLVADAVLANTPSAIPPEPPTVTMGGVPIEER